MAACMAGRPCTAALNASSKQQLRAAASTAFRQQRPAAVPRRLVPAGASENSSSEDLGPAEFLEDLTRDFRGGDAADWEARKARQQEEQKSWSFDFRPDSINETAKPAGLGASVKDAVDKVLIADFFFVCLALLALVLALGEKLALSSTYLLDFWLAAWPTVVQPAIGILMAGALFSGLYGWLQSDILKDK